MSLKFSSNWKKHYLTHASNEDKPHKCDVCGKAFITPVALRKHAATHQKKMKMEMGEFQCWFFIDVLPWVPRNTLRGFGNIQRRWKMTKECKKCFGYLRSGKILKPILVKSKVLPFFSHFYQLPLLSIIVFTEAFSLLFTPVYHRHLLFKYILMIIRMS